mgnify:FL=1|tara:strand:- start:436 stop:717 length:282 start_codon:yes stop_codon:yes gene_type:complete
MYTIISKIELEGTDNLNYSDYGTTTDQDIINQINEDYDSTLGEFLGANRTKLEIGQVSVSTFFETTPFVYEARTEVDNVDELGLFKITTVNQL